MQSLGNELVLFAGNWLGTIEYWQLFCSLQLVAFVECWPLLFSLQLVAFVECWPLFWAGITN